MMRADKQHKIRMDLSIACLLISGVVTAKTIHDWCNYQISILDELPDEILIISEFISITNHPPAISPEEYLTEHDKDLVSYHASKCGLMLYGIQAIGLLPRWRVGDAVGKIRHLVGYDSDLVAVLGIMSHTVLEQGDHGVLIDDPLRESWKKVADIIETSADFVRWCIENELFGSIVDI